MNPSDCVKADGTIDPFREKKTVKASRDILSMKILNGHVRILPQNVTFTCSYCLLTGKFLILVNCLRYKLVFLKIVWIIVQSKRTHRDHMNQCGTLIQDWM